MLPHRLQSVTEIARRVGAGAALLSDPAPLRWIGIPDPHGLHVLISGGDVVVIARNGAVPPSGPPVEWFERWQPEDGSDALERALQRVGLGPTDPVAIDSADPPRSLASAIGGRPCTDTAAELAAVRARKDPHELELITGASELVAVGQGAVRESLIAGVTERDLWEAAEFAMRGVHGKLVTAGVDLIAGPRTTLVGAPPGEYAVGPGDPVLFDLAPCRDGYWSDSCATSCCGEPGERLRRRYDVVRAALDRGLRAARPGITAGFLDHEMRSVLERAGLACPHHMGHGVGAAAQEPPWLLPGEETHLEEGMVVALEPGAYSDGIGVRVEHLMVIEATGARPLTTHSIDLT